MGGQGLLLLIKLNFFKMMIRLQNITVGCQLQSYSWQATVMFCRTVIILINFNSINNRRPWPPILILHFVQYGFFKFLAANFFTSGVLWLGFHSFSLLFLFSFLAKILLGNNMIIYGVLVNCSSRLFQFDK